MNLCQSMMERMAYFIFLETKSLTINNGRFFFFFFLLTSCRIVVITFLNSVDSMIGMSNWEYIVYFSIKRKKDKCLFITKILL